MRIKNINPGTLIEGKETDQIVRLYFYANHLKQLFRQGWLRKGRDIRQKQCESVADHCFLMIVLAVFVCNRYFPKIDLGKLLLLCIVHEFGEIINGDPRTPKTKKGQSLKHSKEAAAIAKVFKGIPEGARYLALWKEFETGSTDEAKLARQLDKLEMAFQAKVYSVQHGKDLQEFIDDARSSIESPELLKLLRAAELL